MLTELVGQELEEIAQDNSYGLLVFKPDAVEKDLVEYLLSHILCSEPFAGKAEVEQICILEPITDPEDVRKIYPNLSGDIWEANLQLFRSNFTVIALLKGNGVDMPAELERIKGKVHTDFSTRGLKEGIRGIIPTIGEEEVFLKIRERKSTGIPLTTEDYFRLARNLVHTPDTHEEKLSILELMKKYEKQESCF
ncbi:MAG TPA: hypothetical protein VHA74_01190 [Candidatus Dojkabacteria bacterium]|nr:hypothetical protein [Candidatus Dojkabacteria bacterium]